MLFRFENLSGASFFNKPEAVKKEMLASLLLHHGGAGAVAKFAEGETKKNTFSSHN